MEFQLIQGSSLYNPSCGYSEETWENDTLDPSDVELDEIVLIRNGKRIEIGGKARVYDMKAAFEKYGIEFATYAVNILLSYTFFMREVEPPQSRHRKPVVGFEKHFKTLLAAGVSCPVDQIDLRKIKFFSGYFAVLKTRWTRRSMHAPYSTENVFPWVAMFPLELIYLISCAF